MSAAGIIIALCLVAGSAIGIAVGEPSLGLLGGLAAGIALAIAATLISGAGGRPR